MRMQLAVLLFVLIFYFSTEVIAQSQEFGTIYTIAGSGNQGFNGDNIPATSAELNAPYGVHVDSIGNIYIADTNNFRVRMVSADSKNITTVAGNGFQGYNGDSIAATGANLNIPYGVFVDSSRNIYIADRGNNRIRLVSANTRKISTIAGNGNFGYNGDNIPATTASLDYPETMFIDKVGNIYIADTNNQRIRKVAWNTGFITTVAGNGVRGYNGDNIPATSANFDYASSVSVDELGNIYIADYGNYRIRMVSAITGLINTVAGNGGYGYNGDNIPATSASLASVQGLFLDKKGNIYIAGTALSRIRMVSANTGYISTVAGTGDYGYNGDNIPATNAKLSHPPRVYVDDSGNIYIADSNNNRIRVVAGNSTAEQRTSQSSKFK